MSDMLHMCVLFKRRKGKRVSYSTITLYITIIIVCIYSPFVHVAKRVDDNNYAAYPPYGHSTVWPGYGYQMDDGEEFAHGEELYMCMSLCVYA